MDGSTTSYSDTDLSGITPGTTLYYQVQAVNGGGSSAWSDPANADSPAVLPAAPDSLYAVAMPGDVGQPDKVQLTWGDSSGNISEYHIQRDTSEDFSSPTTLDPVTPSDMETPINFSGSAMAAASSDPFRGRRRFAASVVVERGSYRCHG